MVLLCSTHRMVLRCNDSDVGDVLCFWSSSRMFFANLEQKKFLTMPRPLGCEFSALPTEPCCLTYKITLISIYYNHYIWSRMANHWKQFCHDCGASYMIICMVPGTGDLNRPRAVSWILVLPWYRPRAVSWIFLAGKSNFPISFFRQC